MKTGRSLQDIAAELERQTNTRKDYIAPQGAVKAEVAAGEIVLAGLNGDKVGIQPYAHSQFAAHLGIPKHYYDRMLTEQPQLLADNINTWMRARREEKRMFRTLDGKTRAFLSPKFRPLDNFDLANVILPTLLENDVQITSAELTETRMYIKGILPRLSDELAPGQAWGVGHDDIRAQRKVVAAIVISNSDVGAGTLRVEPSVYTPWCTNLAILAQAAMKKYHVGRANSADDGFDVFRDETRRADDKAFWLKVRDITVAAFDQKAFGAAIASLRAGANDPIQSTDLVKVVDMTVKQLALPEATGSTILSHLARGGDLTRWGLSSAITRTANDFEDYEGATALERAGGEVMALTAPKWAELAA